MLNTRDSDLRRINTGFSEITVERNGEVFAGVPSESGGQVYLFDAANRHRETIDSATSQTIFSFDYDSNGRFIGVADNFGNQVSIGRDASGLPTQIAAPFGQVTTLELDTERYLARVTNPESEMVSPTINAEGLLTELVDPLGRLHHYEYDGRGRLVLDQLPQGQKTLTREEDADRDVVTVTTALGRSTVYTTEALGAADCPSPGIGMCERKSVLDPAGTLSESFEFRNGTRVVFPGDGSKFVIKAGLDPRFGLGSPKVAAVDVTLSNGTVVNTTYEYSADITDPNNPLSVTRLERISTVNGRPSTSVYDVGARTIAATSPEGRTSVVHLDANSRVIREETPGILPLEYEYDARGRLARVVQGDRETLNGFDAASGFLAQVQTRRNAVDFLTSTFSRDAIGRTVTSVDPDGAVTNLEYDDGGNLLAVNAPDSGDAAHEFSYGPLDQLTGYAPPQDPANRDESYEYNDDDQLLRHVAADGTEHTSSYEGSGLLSALAVDGTTWFSTAYQGGGLHNPTEITQTGVEPGRPAATASFAYDGPDVASTQWTVGGVDRGTVAYDNSGFHTTRTVVETVNGSAVVYQYDDDALLVSAGGVAISRDPQNGRADGLVVGSISQGFGYEPHGAENLATASFGASELYRAELSHDLLGRVEAQTVTIDGASETRSHVYDLAGRLIEVRDAAATVVESYSYDGRGNRLSALGVDPADIAYDFDDRLLAYGDETFEYNGRGDVTQIIGPSGTTSFVYDDTASSPRQITTAGGDVVTYELGPSGSRLSRAVNGVETDHYLWGGNGRPVLVTDPTTGIASRFVYAERSSVPTQMIRSGVSYALITDARGSVRLVVRASDGAVMQRLDYDSYGQVLVDTSPGFQPFGFAGGLYDAVTGFLQLGQRIYHPGLGRFISVDPAGFGDGANRYVYTGGDPINFIDPSGLFSIPVAQRVSEAFVGFADHLTFGLSRRVRHAIGLGDVINECSGWYKGGQFAGEVLDYIGLATLAYGVARWGLRGIAGRFARGCAFSFAAGTMVATPLGLVPIDEIEIGDEVLCRDEQTGIESVCEVSQTHNRVAPATLALTLESGDQTREVIVTTSEHPFYTTEFAAAGHLRAGDVVLGAGDELVEVGDARWDQEGRAVFNLSVEGGRSFFVGESGVWVHNCPTGGAVRHFRSADPHVADIANAIESAYPGHVVGVNIMFRGHEVDILLRNAAIEVKAGRGTGLTRQVLARTSLGLPVIGHAPRLGIHVARDINRVGGIASGGRQGSLQDLIDLVRP